MLDSNTVSIDTAVLRYGGQKEYFRDLIKIVESTPDNKAKGIFYWVPDWIPVEEVGTHRGHLTLFDDDREALPAMDVFAE